MSKLYSFDIFDTLITRKVATPLGIFAIILHSLKGNKYQYIPQHLRDNFYTIRIEAEKFARYEKSLIGEEEITFDELYCIIKNNYNLTEKVISELKKLEIETELKCLLPITENINKIKKLKNEGNKVILISDIYYDKDTIKKFLLRFDNVFKDVPIYLSSEYKVGKHSGNLYKKVMELEHIGADSWVHFGDNMHSDIAMAQKNGITANHYDYYGLYPYENKFVNENSENPFVQITIGTARNTRMFRCNSEKEFFGASFGAVMLYPYVSWLHQQAIDQNITRLYFIARDGYILKKMFDKINEKKKTKIKTFYIYGSRAIWRIPSITMNKGNFDFIFEETWNSKNIEMFLNHFNLNIDDVKKFIPSKYINPNCILKDKDIQKLRTLLLNNDAFKKVFIEKNRSKRNLIIKYLKQEIDVSDDNFAFVDFTGSGITQSCLANLMNTFYKKKIKNFYLRISPSKFKLDNVVLYSMFKNLDYSHFFIEALVRAPHGQTIGYEERENVIYPVLDNLETEALKAWKLDEYINGIKYFMDTYSDIVSEFHLNPTDLNLYCKYFKYIINDIDKYTAEMLGSIPFASQNQIKSLRFLAPKYSDISILNLLFHNVRFDTEMPNVSRIRTDEKIIKKIDKYTRMRTICRDFIKNFIKKTIYKNGYTLKKYFCGILKIKKCSVPFKKEIYFIGIPILQKYKFHINNEIIKKISCFNIGSKHNLYYGKIINIIDKKFHYKHLYFFRHNIGEWYVFLQALPYFSDKKNTLIITSEKKYLELAKFLAPQFDIVYIQLNYLEMDFFTTNELSILKSKVIHIPFKEKFENYRAQQIKKCKNNLILFSDYICGHLGIDAKDVNFTLPVFSDEIKKSVYKKTRAIGLDIDNFIFISTDARSILQISTNFWNDIILKLQKKGRDIYCNNQYILPDGNNLKNTFLTFEEVCYLASLSKGIIALRSGLIDLFSTFKNVPMHIFYTFFPYTNQLNADMMMRLYTLKQFNNNHNIHEYNMDKIDEKLLAENICKNF